MKFPPINPRCPHVLHGGDYNPDQWIQTPEIWDEDMRLMKLSGCNAMTIGIFSWSALEPAGRWRPRSLPRRAAAWSCWSAQRS